MRKGADCLSKWVGEAERQLRLLFEQAKRMQPSIIFFDEIDGLAPVRSQKQDQIHASIVSTMLALMDGLDDRGQVIIIGATNRVDAIDPALRRPGRFDRELAFPLPDVVARRAILDIHTKSWRPAMSDSFKSELAEATAGYCGADVKALCAEAALRCVLRETSMGQSVFHCKLPCLACVLTGCNLCIWPQGGPSALPPDLPVRSQATHRSRQSAYHHGRLCRCLSQHHSCISPRPRHPREPPSIAPHTDPEPNRGRCRHGGAECVPCGPQALRGRARPIRLRGGPTRVRVLAVERMTVC